MDEELVGEINLNAEYGMKPASAEMGSDYSVQSYFDLATNTTVASNHKLDWEIAFSCDSTLVMLNQAISDLRVAKYNGNWTDLVDETTLEFGWDSPSGTSDDFFIGSAIDQIYIVKRGFNTLGEERGYRKIFVEANDGAYTITTALLDGTDERQFTVDTDPAYNFVYAHLENGQVNVAPPKEDWDIMFTHYLYIYDPETEPFPYQVTGCLINPHYVRAYRTAEYTFDEVDWALAQTFNMTEKWDEIGFDWKVFDFDLGFIVDETIIYLVESTEGEFYKMKFTSFYNDQGDKGYPQFMVQKLLEE